MARSVWGGSSDLTPEQQERRRCRHELHAEYRRRFGETPMLGWRQTEEELDALLREAIESGNPAPVRTLEQAAAARRAGIIIE